MLLWPVVLFDAACGPIQIWPSDILLSFVKCYTQFNSSCYLSPWQLCTGPPSLNAGCGSFSGKFFVIMANMRQVERVSLDSCDE